MDLFVYCIGFPLILLFVFLTYKYRNPYKLIMIFGKKGSGKTTLLTKLALKALKKGHPVFSTVYVPGTILFDVQQVGICSFPPESVIFIDEVGMIWDNRDYKKFRTDVRDYFKLQRHYRNTVYLFSQTFDIDIKLRNLTDSMYLCKCYFGWLSMARRIKRVITIIKAQGDSESRIADDIELIPVWMSLFGAGSVKFTFIPRWAKFFNSHEAPALPPIEGYDFFAPAEPKRYRKHLRIRLLFIKIKRKFSFKIFHFKIFPFKKLSLRPIFIRKKLHKNKSRESDGSVEKEGSQV